MTSSSTKFQ
jgi:hypothetical protein